jgi:alpha-ketoglutarate-dependent taurine dioxygenase
LPKVVQGVTFQNGIEIIEMPAHRAARSTSSPSFPHGWLSEGNTTLKVAPSSPALGVEITGVDLGRSLNDPEVSRITSTFDENTVDVSEIRHHEQSVTHPAAGRKALYVSRLMSARIDGFSPSESDLILEQLFDIREHPSIVYAHHCIGP